MVRKLFSKRFNYFTQLPDADQKMCGKEIQLLLRFTALMSLVDSFPPHLFFDDF